jgi:hypothetical protein
LTSAKAKNCHGSELADPTGAIIYINLPSDGALAKINAVYEI